MLENNQRNFSSRTGGMRLSAATLNRITSEELRYPYKTKLRQHLKENDSQRRFPILVTGFSSSVITLKMNGTVSTSKVREYALKG